MFAAIDSKLKLQELCRCCAVKHGYNVNLFTSIGSNNKTYRETITEWTSIQFSENDDLPPFICYSCVLSIESFMMFRKKCIESDVALKQVRDELVAKERAAELLTQIHTECILYECASCDENFVSESKLDAHACHDSKDAAAIVDKVRFACGRCQLPFESQSQLFRHERSHQKRFRCGPCGRMFRQKRSLERHRQRHASEIVSKRRRGRPRKKLSMTRDKDGKFRSNKPPVEVIELEASDDELPVVNLDDESSAANLDDESSAANRDDESSVVSLDDESSVVSLDDELLEMLDVIGAKDIARVSIVETDRKARSGRKTCDVTSEKKASGPAKTCKAIRVGSLFQCEVCARKYNYRRSFDNHVCARRESKAIFGERWKKHFQKRPVRKSCKNKRCECLVCGKNFRSKRRMQAHMSSHVENALSDSDDQYVPGRRNSWPGWPPEPRVGVTRYQSE